MSKDAHSQGSSRVFAVLSGALAFCTFLTVMVMVVVWLESHDSPRFGAMMLTFGVMGGVMMLGALVAAGLHVVGRSRQRRSQPQQGEPLSWMVWTLRQRQAWWSGVWEGRSVSVQSLPRRYGVGPVMLTMPATLSRRGSWLRRRGFTGSVVRFMEGAGGVETYKAAEHGFEQVEVPVVGRRWSDALLSQEPVRGALAALLEHDLGAEVVTVRFFPTGVKLTFAWPPRAGVDALWVKRALMALRTIVEAAEALPPAQEPVKPSWSDRLAADPAESEAFGRRIGCWIVAGTLGVGVVLAALMAVLMLWSASQ